jgi:hypothetical protein
MCFSIEGPDRSLDLSFEDERAQIPWVLALQVAIAACNPMDLVANDWCATHGKLLWKRAVTKLTNQAAKDGNSFQHLLGQALRQAAEDD